MEPGSSFSVFFISQLQHFYTHGYILRWLIYLSLSDLRLRLYRSSFLKKPIHSSFKRKSARGFEFSTLGTVRLVFTWRISPPDHGVPPCFHVSMVVHFYIELSLFFPLKPVCDLLNSLCICSVWKKIYFLCKAPFMLPIHTVILGLAWALKQEHT